ncbi:MAG TPA: Lpg1974 family pore-forming outer membrane protein [Rhizomicrobium sp.]
MSEWKNKCRNRNDIRRQLLATVSAGVLLAATSTTVNAEDDAAGHAPFWIDLGGQFVWNQNDQQAYLSPFVPAVPLPFEVVSPAEVEKPAHTGLDGNAKISFEPAASEWVFSAAITYGRSDRNRFLSQRTETPDTPTGVLVAYQNVTTKNSANHAILDFRAGRDVGLGAAINSTFNLGVRYVQFSAKNNVLLQSAPTNAGSPVPYHRVNAHLAADRKFDGVGPSLSWDASTALIGNQDKSEIALDWGVNGALLFGRQSVRGNHHATTVFYTRSYPKSSSHQSVPLNRKRNMTVPNLGGFAGLSWRTPNAKVSVGYRADFFFGAMDGGIDAARRENVGFYGPFASVSVGIGG